MFDKTMTLAPKFPTIALEFPTVTFMTETHGLLTLLLNCYQVIFHTRRVPQNFLPYP